MERSSSALKKSSAYALASAALGVPAAEAAPIYFSGSGTVYRADKTRPLSSTPIDIDGNAVDDYQLDLFVGSSEIYADWYSLDDNRVRSTGSSLIPALEGGTVIGPGQKFKAKSDLAKMNAGGFGGNWPNDLLDPRFVGLRFLIDDQTHYGWARVGVHLDFDDSVAEAKLYDWAYESTPDTAITTPLPEPSTLALFALGAAGVAALKRRRRQD